MYGFCLIKKKFIDFLLIKIFYKYFICMILVKLYKIVKFNFISISKGIIYNKIEIKVKFD